MSTLGELALKPYPDWKVGRRGRIPVAQTDPYKRFFCNLQTFFVHFLDFVENLENKNFSQKSVTNIF